MRMRATISITMNDTIMDMCKVENSSPGFIQCKRNLEIVTIRNTENMTFRSGDMLLGSITDFYNPPYSTNSINMCSMYVP